MGLKTPPPHLRPMEIKTAPPESAAADAPPRRGRSPAALQPLPPTPPRVAPLGAGAAGAARRQTRLKSNKCTQQHLVIVALLFRTAALSKRLKAIQRVRGYARQWRDRRSRDSHLSDKLVATSHSLVRIMSTDRLQNFLKCCEAMRQTTFVWKMAYSRVRSAAKLLQKIWRQALGRRSAGLKVLRYVWTRVWERKGEELQAWANRLDRIGNGGQPAAWLAERRNEFERRKVLVLGALKKTPGEALSRRRSVCVLASETLGAPRALDVSDGHRDALLRQYFNMRTRDQRGAALAARRRVQRAGPFEVADARDWVHGANVERAARVMVTAHLEHAIAPKGVSLGSKLSGDVEALFRRAVRERSILTCLDAARRHRLGGAWRRWKLDGYTRNHKRGARLPTHHRVASLDDDDVASIASRERAHRGRGRAKSPVSLRRPLLDDLSQILERRLGKPRISL
ncbi:hypothetical protein M885DRAFT_504734 [Pelagophyceae sp. CCMP2097]|nr:hypothetical protein M885DRAFT_504734 [Pelagophyceae sp. CCMP2097]